MVFTATPRPAADGIYVVKAWTFKGVTVGGALTPVTSLTYTIHDLNLLADGDTVTIMFESVYPTITKTTLNPGKLLVEYGDTLTATGNGPFTWEWSDALAGQKLPPGLTLKPDGTIEGTPENSGTFTFNVTVTDRFGKPDIKPVTVYIAGEYEIIFMETLASAPAVADNSGGIISAQIGSRVISSGKIEPEGTNITFAALAKPGHVFMEWKVEQWNGAAWITGVMPSPGLYNRPDNTILSYTLINLRTDIRVSAVFAAISSNIVNFSVMGGNGRISAAVGGSPVNTGNAIAAGTDITFTAVPNSGFQVKEWTLQLYAKNAGQ
jgi:hypothetical protein